jgi:GR25 family glycosyltransferase involved in LPS biosynthesis
MINSNIELFKKTENALNKARTSNNSDLLEFGYILGVLSENTLNFSDKMYEDMSILSYKNGDYTRSFDNSVKCMNNLTITEDECKRLRFNQHFSIDKISERYLEYNIDNISKMVGILLKNRRKQSNEKHITITMTSCKRYDLFYKTVSSFINCCLDTHLIDEWIVIDDNSSSEDRIKMMTDFPFIKYIWKTIENKGHPRSMNILKEIVKTPYVFHIEDDWLFFRKENYLTNCKFILQQDKRYGQCLLNRCYGERAQCHDITGGCIQKINNENKIRYYEHEFYTGVELEQFCKNNARQCAYWPHYSLRVGMTKTQVWNDVGLYNEKNGHFEMEYAQRYVEKGYKTVYLDNIFCLHIGRCTFERNSDKTNAYDLNSESQFGEPLKKINSCINELSLTPEELSVSTYADSSIEYNKSYKTKTYILNLKHRSDRAKNFIIQNHDELEKLQYEFFSAIDGKKIEPKPKTLKLFESGDYQYRRGILGCASSSILMWHNFIICKELDVLLVIEDDSIMCKNFIDKLVIALKKLPPNEWDILFLGHFLYPQYRKESDREDKVPSVSKWTKEDCQKYSMGGTIGYAIHKRGAIKMFQHINKYGMYNAIDWVMFKTADVNNIYYCYPHILYSECVTNEIKPDSDIQYDTTTLCVNDNHRLELEMKYWIKQLKQGGVNFTSGYETSIPHSPDSKIIYKSNIPTRDELLQYILFINIKNSNDKFKTLIDKLKKLPVQYYTIKDIYIITIPNPKITEEIINDVTFGEDYLNIDHPIL